MAAITKSAAKKMLGNVSEDKRFWSIDGKYLSNLDELKDALERMTPETFRAHSNENKTDFSNWVKDVIGDSKLASDLLKCTTKAQAAKSVADRIAWLREKASA
jgi:hypothetical protein